MIRKLSVVITFFAVSGVSVFAQQTPPPAPPAPPVGRVQALALGSMFDESYLGVQMKEISRENFGQFGLREVRGVAVDKVVENSPAQRAGLQAGDVIVRFEGAEVTSIRKLQRLISEVAPDHQATLTVFRNGSEREIKVTMGKREVPRFEDSANLYERLQTVPSMPAMPRVPLPPSAMLPPSMEREGFYSYFGSNRQIGISVTSLTGQLGEYFGADEGKGVLISAVRENSAARKAGLRAGDVIVEVDGKEVKSTFDLTRLINERKEGAVNLTVLRNKSRINVSVEPEKSGGNLRIITPDGNDSIIAPGAVINSAPGRIL